MSSVFDIFNRVGANVWWDKRHMTQAFNNRNEKGQDFGLPLNTPVASISSGRVIYAQRMNSDPGSSVGYIVQVENADGSIFHYQHLRTAQVQVGDYVRVGQVLGLSGGCPANGYGSGGCTHTDQYTTGPHIEVRYSPTYDASKGAWGQHWIDPGPAFQAYGGAQVSDLLPPGWGQISGATGSVLSLPSNFGDILAAGLGAGISRGFEQFAQDEIHPVVDFAARSFLIGMGSILVAVALFAVLIESGREEVKQKVIKPGAKVAAPAIAAEVGGQTARAVVPPFGDQKRAQAQRPAIPAPAARPALPAPSGEPTYEEVLAGQKRADERAKRLQQGAGVNPNIAKNYGTAEVFGVAKEIKPVDLPIPHEAQEGAQRRQVENRAKRDREAVVKRIKRSIRRRS